MDRFFSHAEQNQYNGKYQLYGQCNAAPFHILLIGVQDLAVPVQEERGVLSEEYRVQKHSRSDAQHKGYNGQHLGNSQGHEDGKDDNADSYHCAGPEQGGKYGSRNNAQKDTGDGGLVAAQLRGLADKGGCDACL